MAEHIDAATGLPVRTYGPLVKDPDLSVLIDSLLQRGANIAEWTDEEAERCRLAAFFPETGMWSHEGHLFPCRIWIHSGAEVVIERPFSAYDPSPDCEVMRPVENWGWGHRSPPLPLWCSASSEGVYGEVREVLPWPDLVRLARERLATQRAERSKRRARRGLVPRGTKVSEVSP